MDIRTRTAIRAMLARIKADSFVSGYKASDVEGMGLLLSKYFELDGVAILQAASRALEDANFHTDAATLDELAAKYQPDPDAPMDDDMRKAIFAGLRETYGTSVDRDRRLRIVNNIVRRTGPAVDSFSNRAMYPLTRREAGQVLNVLNA